MPTFNLSQTKHTHKPSASSSHLPVGISKGKPSSFATQAHRQAVNAVSTAPLEDAEVVENSKFASPPGDLKDIFSSYQKGYLSVSSHHETEGWCEVEGKIPDELTGTLLRNGPALFEREGFKKVFLDGDGMVSSIAIKDGKAYFRNKFVRTESFAKEEEAGKFLDLSIFSAVDPRPSASGMPLWKHRLIDDIFRGPPSPKNNGAFNAWYWAGSLVAVDFGRPFGLDKTTLDTVGDVDTFSSMRYTAHSRILEEKDGSLRLCAFQPYADWAKNKTFVTFMEFDEQGACTKVFKLFMIKHNHLYKIIDVPSDIHPAEVALSYTS